MRQHEHIAPEAPFRERARGRWQRFPLSRGANAVLAFMEAALSSLAAAILAVLLVVVIVAIVLRYVFGTAILGSDELAIWLNIALIGTGAPLAASGALGMRLDVIAARLPARAAQAANILAEAVTMLGALVLVSGGATVIEMLGGISPALGLPEWVRFSFLCAGGALTLLAVTLRHVAERRLVMLAAALVLAIALYFWAGGSFVTTVLPPSAVAGLVAVIGLCAGAPLPHLFLASAYLAIPFGAALPEPAIVSTTVGGMSKFLLLAIPFFLLAGSLFSVSSLGRRLVGFAGAMVGHRRGGLAQTTLLTSFLFSGASGSSVANAAFAAGSLAPALVARGYAPERAGAIVAASSVLDNVIPPSIAFLILAVATNLSVGRLLVGGLFAGLVMALALAMAIHFTASAKDVQPRSPAAVRRRAALGAIPVFGLGLVVVAGIRFGLTTPTEAAALAALYTFSACLLGGTGFRDLFAAFRDAAVKTASVGLLIGAAAPIAFLFAVDDIAGAIEGVMGLLGSGPIGVMGFSVVVLLIAGLVLDIGAALLLLGPVLLPLAVGAGIDPIHFGVITVVALMIGGLTPPVGILVFVVSGVMRLPAAAIFRSAMPYVAALAAVLLLFCTAALVWTSA
ncbi:MAG: TRAP transporter large permease subunit [Rhizobiaceae bacterium]|nr:TRAP transporter large permease subunit [Rhizobiaceae bacterium]MCV0408398.1 TRAP transporter large permease subunit [Rhizobiaceae bacterium]